ncbi:9278_t:CDS:2 [Entrophospora sp. SA101]|nr:9278_t:CDS:2 [Entrophospora sp. SA101]
MPYQAFSETGDTVVNMEDEEGVNENSPLYPFGVPVILLNVKSQMAFVRKVCMIFALQLIVTIAFTVLSLILLVGITWKSNDSFQPPWYLVVLYTLLNAVIIAAPTSLLRLFCVLDALIILLIQSRHSKLSKYNQPKSKSNHSNSNQIHLLTGSQLHKVETALDKEMELIEEATSKIHVAQEKLKNLNLDNISIKE